MNLQTQAKAIGDQVAPTVGFDPITIITLLLPMLVTCFKQSTAASETPQEFLADHFDEHTSSFDQSLVNRCRPQTRRAARQDGKRHLTRYELDEITVATLERARTADPDTVDAVMQEVG